MYEYMSEMYTLMYPEAGLVFTFMSPRKHERLSVRSGLYFNKSEYKAHVDLETRYTIESHDTYINLATLSIPFSIVYAIPLGKYSLSVQPGIQCQYFLKNDTRVLGEIINIYAPDINKDDIAFEMYKFTIGSSCGLAIARSFKNFTMETMVKHNYFPDYNKEEGLKVLNSNIGISFIISPSFK